MKKLLLTTALVLALAAPAFAEEMAPAAAAEAAVAAPAVEAVAPAVMPEATTPAADDAVTTACKTEVAAKITLADNASAEERAQFEAAVAECVATKTPAAPAAEGEAAADTASHEGHTAEVPASE